MVWNIYMIFCKAQNLLKYHTTDIKINIYIYLKISIRIFFEITYSFKEIEYITRLRKSVFDRVLDDESIWIRNEIL